MLRTPLYANSIYLILNALVTSVLGFVFWLVVARLYESQYVGQGSALISIAGFLAFVGTLGLSSGLIRFLPGSGEKASNLINSSQTLSVIMATVVVIIFLVGMPLWAPSLMFIRENVIFLLVFISLAVAGTTILILTGVFIGLRRAEFVAVQNGGISLLKVILVIALAVFFQTFGIVASWALGQLLAVGLSIFLFLPRVQPGYKPTPRLHNEVTDEVMRFSLANYVADGLWAIPNWLLPLMVVNMLGSEATAHFYMSWAMIALLSAISTGTSLSLFAEGSHDQAQLRSDLSRSIKFIFVLLIPAMIIMFLIGSRLLLVYGREYSDTGTRLLWILTASALPMSVNYIYLSVLRITKRFKEMILFAAVLAFGTLGLSYALLLPLGIEGAGIAWLVTHILLALVVVIRLKKVISDKPEEISAAK
jgi:O-antigen/teichoic acid export membrane protein